MEALAAFGWERGSALLRWLHITAVIAWIGGSFSFMHLDASLRKRAGAAPELAGVSWQVHVGGFNEMRKYLLAPASLPEHLIWHKWQSYLDLDEWLCALVLGLLWPVHALSDRSGRHAARALAGGADWDRCAGRWLDRPRFLVPFAACPE
jgi:uncharacterized membrane protein